MPFIRRKRRFRRFHRKPKSKSLSSVQKSEVKSLIKRACEPKYYKTSSGSVATSTAIDVDLSAMSQGDTEITRDGARIEPTSISIKGTIIRDAGVTAGSWDRIRMILVQWFPDSANDDCTFPDILEGYSQATAYYDPYVMAKAYRKKFAVLADKTFLIAERTSGTGMLNFERTFQFSRKITRPIYYNTGVTTGKNHIFLLLVGSQTSTAEDCNMSYTAKLNFKDV